MIRWFPPLAAALLALSGCDTAPHALTTERLTQEKMEQLAAAPMAHVRRGDMAAAEAMIAAAVRRIRAARGPSSTEEHDLVMAFAVGLYMEGKTAESLAWMRMAVAAAQRAFGPQHPETALALHSYADLLDTPRDGVPPPQAMAVMEQALAIRRAALPPDHPELPAAIDSLARMNIRAAMITKDRRHAARAEALVGELGTYEGELADGTHVSLPMLRSELAMLYAASGRADALLGLIEEDERRNAREASVASLIWRRTAELITAHTPGGRVRPRGGCIEALGILWGEELRMLEQAGKRREAAAIRARECAHTRNVSPPAI
jgi:hypothetical protein